MYELAWGAPDSWSAENNTIRAGRSRLPRHLVSRTMLLHWEEHCLECAAPACFQSCALYSRRTDGNCVRLNYGIVPNRAFHGLFDYGADLRFKRWGKIETILFGPPATVAEHHLMSRLNAGMTNLVRLGARVLQSSFPNRNLTDLRNYFRNRYMLRVPNRHPIADYDEFVVECYSPDPKPFRLLLEYRLESISVFRHAFSIQPGHNYFSLPAGKFRPLRNAKNPLLTIFPENDAECRLIFTWLDFVKYHVGAEIPTSLARPIEKPIAASASPQTNAAAPATHDLRPAAKIKCVAWDLDNTLWNGTLVEDTAAHLSCRAEAIALVKALDERGILQTVVSKNNHDEAWGVITKNALEDYFLYPAINWGQKSESLKQIAARLNINIDTFALIDDSAFERGEVERALPMVRTYSDAQIGELLERPEFDIPITEMSRARRQSYRVEILREKAAESSTGDYADFLRSCGMKMRVFIPTQETEIERCLELVQRSNQLNLSSRRHTAGEFAALLNTPGILPLAIHCEDKFGDYGIVGFASVDERGDAPVVDDFILSCRVAQKRVEHTLFEWLANREQSLGYQMLLARLVVTDRNGPLRKVFEDLPFRRNSEEGRNVMMEMPLEGLPPRSTVIELSADVPGSPAPVAVG